MIRVSFLAVRKSTGISPVGVACVCFLKAARKVEDSALPLILSSELSMRLVNYRPRSGENRELLTSYCWQMVSKAHNHQRIPHKQIINFISSCFRTAEHETRRDNDSRKLVKNDTHSYYGWATEEANSVRAVLCPSNIYGRDKRFLVRKWLILTYGTS
jgi:hypothetical protein